MNNILGEEADIGQCEFCGKTKLIDEGISCEGCAGFNCSHKCQRNHDCTRVTDRNGKLVKIGDVLKYPENKDIFTVIEMLPSFAHVGSCMAERRRGKERMPIIPRLMDILESKGTE